MNDASFCKRKIQNSKRKIEILEKKIKFYENMLLEMKDYQKEYRQSKRVDNNG